MPRLPKPGQDVGSWGQILNEFLSVSLNSDGTIKQSAVGSIGVQGATGATGPVGVIGPQGPQGNQGERGLQGPIGQTGATGAAGPQGAMGPTGLVGSTGSSGHTGATGAAGTGVPSGGAVDQVLSKATASDYDTQWTSIDSLYQHSEVVSGVPQANVIVLTSGAPIPPGTPDMTIIARPSVPVPTPAPEMKGLPATTAINSGNTMILSKPMGLSDNEMLIAFVNQGLTGSSIVAPTGWIRLHYISGVDWSAMRTTEIWGKYITNSSAEPSGYTFTFSQTGRLVGALMRFANVDPLAPLAGVSPIPTSARQLPGFTVTADDSLTVFAGITIATSGNVLDPLSLSEPTATSIINVSSSTDTSITRQGLHLYSVPSATPSQNVITYTSSAPAANETAIGIALKKA